MSDGTDESVWWGASIAADDEDGGVGSARLTYVPQHGFDEEQRRVIFLEGSFLWDAALRERLPYRREGEECVASSGRSAHKPPTTPPPQRPNPH